MRRLSAFNFISLNGFYKGLNGDISWHRHGEEENTFSADSLGAGNILLFGRITYEMMAAYWPSPMALQNDPVNAAGMNRAQKIVFSRTLKETNWENSTLIKDNITEEIAKMKRQDGKHMTILGSGSIITQFAEAGLIDEYMFMIDPVAIPEGTAVFDGIRHKLDLELIAVRHFKSGTVLLTYRPL